MYILYNCVKSSNYYNKYNNNSIQKIIQNLMVRIQPTQNFNLHTSFCGIHKFYKINFKKTQEWLF